MKLKLSFFLLLFSIVSLNSFSQYIPLLQNNAIWYEYYHFEASWNYSLTIAGDTTVNDTVYKIIKDDPPNSIPFTLLREDTLTKKVFRRWYSGNEKMIYNFNMSIGDTIFINGIQHILLSISDSIPSYCDLGDLVSCSIVPLHVFEFGPNTDYPVCWIEGIGSLSGLLNSGKIWCNDYLVLCHFDSNQTWNYYHKVWNEVAPCEGYVSVPLIKGQPPVNVFPNPSSDGEVFIEGKNIYKARIINLQGLFLEEIFLSDRKMNKIHLNLPQGMYFIEIYSIDDVKSTRKILMN